MPKKIIPLLGLLLLLGARHTVGAQILPSPQADSSLKEVKAPSIPSLPTPSATTPFRIKLPNLSFWSVCPGSTVVVPFEIEGEAPAGTRYEVQLIDAANNFIAISSPKTSSPISALIPSDKKADNLYRLRIIASGTETRSNEVPVKVLPKPTAKLETQDGGLVTRIMPGQQARLRVQLSGSGPWSFLVSDGTMVEQTFTSPYYFLVKPQESSTYTLVGVSNACGSGEVQGAAVVNVNANPEPILTMTPPAEGRVCVGTPFQVPFSASGKYLPGNGFVVQLTDSLGRRQTISLPDTLGPLVAKIPDGTRPGRYSLRVLATDPELASNMSTIEVVAPTRVTLLNDDVKIKEGESASVRVRFEGGGPWFVLLSDGTYRSNITTSPASLRVTPSYTTSYSISSAGGLCGVGDYTGRAVVQVEVPPVSINMGPPSQNTICANSEVEIPFTITGRFAPANTFTVQIADDKGGWVNVPTSPGTSGTLKAKVVPPFQTDTIQVHRLRIVASQPGTVSDEQTIRVIAPNIALGVVSGRATIASGGATRIRLLFKNGLPPWSFTLSDGTSISGTFLNPYLITVSPTTTTTYTLRSLQSSCGMGTSVGSAQVTVER